MRKGILQGDFFYCDHLGASCHDEHDVLNFSVDRPEGFGLVSYVQRYAFSDEAFGVMRTYVVRDLQTSELVGYFSLKSGLVSLNEREVEVQEGESKRTEILFDTVPGVELANFAINSSYIKNRPSVKGIGVVLFQQFVLPIVRQVAENVAVTILYIFALPYDGLIKRYKDVYGFERLGEYDEHELHKRLKPAYDQSCVFMYVVL